MDSIVKKITRSINDQRDWKELEVLQLIRASLQFTPVPTTSSIKEGVVDCVGAAVIGSKVFSKLFPSNSYSVAHVPNVPWTAESSHDSKHCAIVQVNKSDSKIRFIDTTPINGYGYGRISSWTPTTWWNMRGSKYVASQRIKELNWLSYLYPSFRLIDTDEVRKILGVSQMKNDLQQGSELKNLGIPQSAGWSKDYYRTLASHFSKKGDVDTASQMYLKAIDICPNNPYLLREVIEFFQKQKFNYPQLNLLRRKEREGTSRLISLHEQACLMWKKEMELALEKDNYHKYLYIAGCLFWRRQSIDLLLEKNPEPVVQVSFRGQSLPLYRLLPAWFSANDLRVIVSKKKPDKAFFSQKYELRYENRLALRAIRFESLPEKGWVSIIHNSSSYHAKENVFSNTDSHLCLCALLDPRLMVVYNEFDHE